MSSNNYSWLPIIRTFKGNRKNFELLRVKLYGKSSEGKANYHHVWKDILKATIMKEVFGPIHTLESVRSVR